MNKQTYDLYVFGYGLSLIFPYLVWVHGLHLKAGFVPVALFVAGFAALLYILTKIARWKPVYNGWIVLPIAVVMIQNAALGFLRPGTILLAGSLIVLFVTIIDVEKLQCLYTPWMKLAHGIGNVIGGVVLTVFFYLVFGSVGIILRVLHKDILERKPQRGRDSYWIPRQDDAPAQERYPRQF